MTRRRHDPDHLIDALIKGEPLPRDVIDDPDQVAALRAAVALRAARPGADLPSESFLTDLRQQLEDVDRSPATRTSLVSRRRLLAGAGIAAAGVAGALVEREVLTSGSSSRGQVALEPDDGEWLAVATESELAGGAVKGFSAPALAGFVSQQTNGELLAVSGACTHLGCLLQANGDAGRLDCPCHHTAFEYTGQVLFSQLTPRPAPLPTLSVRRRNGSVEVFVPRQV